MASLMEKIVMFTNQCKTNSFHSCICILFFFNHPIDNTLAVQYQLVQGRLNYVYIRKKKKEKENWNGEGHIIVKLITRLTLFNN